VWVADKNGACSIFLCVAQGAKPELVAELRFDIPAMYVFHKETSKDVAVRETLQTLHAWPSVPCAVFGIFFRAHLFLVGLARSETHPAGRFA
jgi:hypothetical protein